MAEIKRKANGQFAKGTSGNQGNKSSHTMFTRHWLKQVKLKHIQEVYNTIVSEALNGDFKFIKLFMEYTLKRPDQLELETNEQPKLNPNEIRNEFNKIFRSDN